MVTDAVQQQCEADMDTSIQSRLFMGAGAAAKGTVDTLTGEEEGNEGMRIGGGTYTRLYNYSMCMLDLYFGNRAQ